MAVGTSNIKGDDLVDRISELPDNLRGLILEKLPLAHAIRTSILSREWRFSWTRLGILKFGQDIFQRQFTALEYSKVTDRVLLLHDGPVQTFDLDMPQNILDDFESFDINVWLRILSRKGIQKISIAGYVSDKGFPIPSGLFQCHELRELDISACQLTPPPGFSGFSNLVLLDFTSVDITSHLLGNLITQCQQLENLVLEDTCGYYYETEPLVLNNPSIRDLYFIDWNLSGVILENIPNLTALKLIEQGYDYDKKPDVPPQQFSSLELMCAFPGIEKLCFDLTLLKSGHGDCPKSLSVALKKLISLKIYKMDICNSDDISLAFCLIRSAPHLRILKLGIMSSLAWEDEDLAAPQYIIEEGSEQDTLRELTTMNVSGFTGSQLETLLIKTLLARCPVLEIIRINPCPHMDNSAEKKLLRELLQFRRFSNKAEVVFAIRNQSPAEKH